MSNRTVWKDAKVEKVLVIGRTSTFKRRPQPLFFPPEERKFCCCILFRSAAKAKLTEMLEENEGMMVVFEHPCPATIISLLR